MKVTGKTTHTTTITGEISKAELVKLIREHIGIPDGAEVRVFVRDASEVDLEDGDDGIFAPVPLRFEVTVTGEVPATPIEPTPRGELATLDHAPVCSAQGCQFPSLSGGLCPSHLSQAHRTRYTGGAR